MSNPYAQNENQTEPLLNNNPYPQPSSYPPPPPPPPPNQGFNPNQNQGFNPNQNQGFNPNQNQGFNPNHNQGFNPNQNGGHGMICPVCRRETDNFPRKVAGGVTWIWCVVLFILTGIFCCWVPFCVDNCQDTQMVCVVCQATKATIPANCC